MFLLMPVLGDGVYSTASHLEALCRFTFIVTSCLSDTESSNRFSLNQNFGEGLCLMLESALGPRLPGMHLAIELSYCPPVMDRRGTTARK